MTNFSPIDEIKSKLDLVEVISEYVRLTPAGMNMKALCPFHKEKVPSFFVSSEKQIWKCFGCNRGGNIFDFIMEIEGVDFPQALRILAKKAGVILKTYDYHLTSKRTKLLDICREAASYYHWYLLNAKNAEEARKYLAERKISQAMIKEWQLGYSPNEWRVLYQNLIKKGYKAGDIEESGLIVKQPETEYYDRFRGRIIFPINDLFGNVIGFSGRIMPFLEKEDVPKYINTPETLIYNKSRVLYGLDKAKLEIKKRNYTILVEGNVDVISAHQAGTKNTVAISGSVLTLTQIKILKRYSPNFILAFDLDPSGETSTKRGIDIALSQEMNIKVLTLPEGKDPDECIKKNKKLWLKAIKDSQPIMEYYFSSTFRDLNPEQLTDKKKAVKNLLPIISKIGNLIEQDFWLKKLAEKIKISYEVLREDLKKILKKETIKEEEFKIEKPDQELIAQEKFVGLLAKFPEQVSSFYEELDEEIFLNEKLRTIISYLKKSYSLISLENKKISLDDFKKDLGNENLQLYLNFLVLAIEKDFTDFEKKVIDKELEFLFKILKKNFILKKIKSLSEDLKVAEKEKDKEKIKKLSEEVIKLTRELEKF